MFSIFSSPKKLVIESPKDPQHLLWTFRSRVGDNTLAERVKCSFSFHGNVLGKIEGHNVRLTYQWAVHNSLEPTMLVHIEGTANGGSVLLARFTTSLWVRVLISIWLGFAALFGIYAVACHQSSDPINMVMGIALLLFGLIAVAIMRIVAAHNEAKLEKFVREVAADSTV